MTHGVPRENAIFGVCDSAGSKTLLFEWSRASSVSWWTSALSSCVSRVRPWGDLRDLVVVLLGASCTTYLYPFDLP